MSDTTWENYIENKHFKPSPLKGVKVLEVCTMLLGPIGPALLAQLGAEVIRCEFPPLGDATRSLNPFGWFLKDQSALLLHINQNKYWLGLDLHKPEGQRLFCELAAKSDIVENNFRPGVLEEWNIGYQQIREINPRIIFISKNGYGQWGPYARENRPSNDGASQALTGYSYMSRFPGHTPLKQRAYVGDNYGGLCAEIAVLMALHYRDRTGKGQYIEFSQTENVFRTMSWIWPYQQFTGKTAEPAGNRDVSICPADTFRCADGRFVALAAADPREFAGLCAAMGRPELPNDPRFRDHAARLKEENATAILKIIAEWAKTRKPEEIESLAEKHGFAATHLFTGKDLVENEQFNAHDFRTDIDDPLLGLHKNYEFPVKMSESPPNTKWSVRPVGFDNEYVMQFVLGKTDAEVEQLYRDGVLGKWKDVIGRRPPPDWDGKAGLIVKRDEIQSANEVQEHGKQEAAGLGGVVKLDPGKR
jgi:crotonobetainyl-CoA:carnitine CoA-transferase CaiB-like acyl-CoA transferase